MHRRGFTMIELMVTIAVATVLIALAVPSFRTYTAKKKVEGTLAELATDLQFARSEAVSRNMTVRFSVGPNCYVIYPITPGVVTVGPPCAVPPTATNLRSVTVDDQHLVNLAPEGSLTWIDFDQVRGEASFAGLSPSDIEAAINVTSTANVSSAFNLRARVTKFGRVQVCTTNSMSGYSACN